MRKQQLQPGTQTPALERSEVRSGSQRHSWLLFVHQLPARPTSLRVRTWRRLQQLGAITVKQAVYVLPDSPNAREDFEWLKTEIQAGGGEVSIFAANMVDSWSDDALVEEFRRSREEAYDEIVRAADRVLRRLSARRHKDRPLPSRRELQQLRERLAAVERIDFFGSAGRDRVLTLLRQLEDRVASPTKRAAAGGSVGGGPASTFQARVWVTRPRPGVDRMASAWLIRRFIDPQAQFAFASDRDAVPEGGVAYDMFGVEFSHQGEGCTFETLCSAFRIGEAPVVRIAGIVHDLDLKDGRFGPPELGTVGALIEGLQLSVHDDLSLLEHGMTLFESLYRSFERSGQARGPRLAARPKSRRTAAKGSHVKSPR